MSDRTCNAEPECVEDILRRGACKKHFHRQWNRAVALGKAPSALTDAELAAVPTTRQKGKHPFRVRYFNMVYRCTNPEHPRYPSYGGRGITVCPRWLGPGGFDNYLADIGPQPLADGQRWSVDRADNNGPYCGGGCGGVCGYGTEGNVRWATDSQQMVNRRAYTFNKQYTVAKHTNLDVVCQECGTPFGAMRSTARFCSVPCGVANRKRRSR